MDLKKMDTQKNTFRFSSNTTVSVESKMSSCQPTPCSEKACFKKPNNDFIQPRKYGNDSITPGKTRPVFLKPQQPISAMAKRKRHATTQTSTSCKPSGNVQQEIHQTFLDAFQKDFLQNRTNHAFAFNDYNNYHANKSFPMQERRLLKFGRPQRSTFISKNRQRNHDNGIRNNFSFNTNYGNGNNYYTLDKANNNYAELMPQKSMINNVVTVNSFTDVENLCPIPSSNCVIPPNFVNPNHKYRFENTQISPGMFPSGSNFNFNVLRRNYSLPKNYQDNIFNRAPPPYTEPSKPLTQQCVRNQKFYQTVSVNCNADDNIEVETDSSDLEVIKEDLIEKNNNDSKSLPKPNKNKLVVQSQNINSSSKRARRISHSNEGNRVVNNGIDRKKLKLLIDFVLNESRSEIADDTHIRQKFKFEEISNRKKLNKEKRIDSDEIVVSPKINESSSRNIEKPQKAKKTIIQKNGELSVNNKKPEIEKTSFSNKESKEQEHKSLEKSNNNKHSTDKLKTHERTPKAFNSFDISKNKQLSNFMEENEDEESARENIPRINTDISVSENSEPEDDLIITKGILKKDCHNCHSCELTLPKEFLWINALTREVRCLNCFAATLTKSGCFDTPKSSKTNNDSLQ